MFKKKVKLYCVFDAIGDKLGALRTVTSSRKEAEEWIYKRATLNHIDHFEHWCSLRNVDPLEAVNDYMRDVIPEELDKFRIAIFKYDTSTLAANFRLFLDVEPIGCSFETEQEIELYNKALEEREKSDDEDGFKFDA